MKPSDYIRKGWCQESFAKTKTGNIVYGDDPAAVCWCLDGAIDAACGRLHSDEKENITAKLREKIDNYIGWNDTPGRTQQEVIDLLESIGE